LNTLRGVRVTANVGGALVGFILPGHGGVVLDLLEELVIAPALVTGVEAVTTGAVESFVRGRKAHLVEQLKRDAHAPCCPALPRPAAEPCACGHAADGYAGH
jgi:hypothetical protein